MVTFAATVGDWFGTELSTLAYVALSALGVYAAVILIVRVNGLRSFSQMTAFDFATTVAMGTIVASTTISSEVSLPEGATAALALLTIQSLVAMLRRKAGFGALVDNAPIVVMRDGRILEDRLAATNLTRPDLISKLREAGVTSFDQVRLVVFETTGKITVLRGTDEIDPRLLEGVVE